MRVVFEKIGEDGPEGAVARLYEQMDDTGQFNAHEIREALGLPDEYADTTSAREDSSFAATENNESATECNGGDACYPGGRPDGPQACSHTAVRERTGPSRGYLLATGVLRGTIDPNTLPKVA